MSEPFKHPTMTLSGAGDGLTIKLSPLAAKELLAGRAIERKSADAHGVFTVTVKMTRPRSRDRRYPKELGYPDALRR